MFKVFELESGKEVTKRYALTSSGVLIDVKSWSCAKEEDFLIVLNSSLTKENKIFTLIEPANKDYVVVYKIRGNYIAFDYNELDDPQGIWYLVKDIKEFKEIRKNDYSFIQYNDNYTEELM